MACNARVANKGAQLGLPELQLGAQPLCERGLADWQAPLGVAGALDAWLGAPRGLCPPAVLAATLEDAAKAAAARRK
jgi:enoyl-CoA hydratase/carnithine racemase